MTCLCRLLRDLHTVEANLEFWQSRLHQGSHLRFMLFGQGPVSFAHDVLCTLERKHRQRMISATDKIERRVSSALRLTTTPCLVPKNTQVTSRHSCPWFRRRSVLQGNLNLLTAEPFTFGHLFIPVAIADLASPLACCTHCQLFAVC